MNTTLIGLLVMLTLVVSPVLGQVPQLITYQGFLADATGEPVVDGSYAMTFRIFDVATGGTALWTETWPGVSVSDGLFRVFLGQYTLLGIAFDMPYWLEVQVGTGTPQSPRTELASTPYSLMSADADEVDGFDASALPVANHLLALDATGKFPVSAIPAAPPGGTAGGDLTGTYPNPTIATSAVNSAKIADGQVATEDLATGAVSSAKILDGAVHTQDISDGAVTQAKLDPAVTLPPGGAAGGDLAGTYPNPTIAANAVTSSKIQDGAVQTADIQNNAVTAEKISPNVISSLDGVSNDAGNIDLVAGANITITPNDGANTITINAAGGGGGDITAVWPDGSGTIAGGASSGDAYLGVANPLEITGSSEGVIRGTHTDGNYGYFGMDYRGAAGFNANGNYGSLGSDGVAVYGYSASNGSWGGLGDEDYGASGTHPSGNNGKLGTSDEGVYGSESGGNYGYLGHYQRGAAGYNANGKYGTLGSAGYGVYYSGGLGGSGSKSCVVRTSYGPKALYCQESPESWFEDFGQGALVNGRARVDLDPLFLETVTIDAGTPMKVFVELGGDCNGVYVEKGTMGFDVIELRGGSSSVPFDYRVVAKRKGFEEIRMEHCQEAETDAYLYPELREQQRQEHETKEARGGGDRSGMQAERAVAAGGGALER